MVDGDGEGENEGIDKVKGRGEERRGEEGMGGKEDEVG